MAMPNEVLGNNGEASGQGTKRKSGRKVGASVRDQVAAAAKRLVTGKAVPVEILFTKEPNPSVVPVPPYLWIDHPTPSETLRTPTYAIRLGADGVDLVEISIDKSSWIPCRWASGYWWYDWSAIAPGKHTLVARMRASDGRWFKTPPRACTYRTE